MKTWTLFPFLKLNPTYQQFFWLNAVLAIKPVADGTGCKQGEHQCSEPVVAGRQGFKLSMLKNVVKLAFTYMLARHRMATIERAVNRRMMPSAGCICCRVGTQFSCTCDWLSLDSFIGTDFSVTYGDASDLDILSSRAQISCQCLPIKSTFEVCRWLSGVVLFPHCSLG